MAREHQSKYRAEVLQLDDYNDYGNRLARKDAAAGKNFYTDFPGLFKEVKKRFPHKYSPLYYDMLRSEHIPFNFFAPLKLQKEKQLTKDIFNFYLNETIQKVENIVIEYAPMPKKKYLDDNTSFDAYIEYIHRDGGKGAIGIEVKYTEREYSYGQTEKKRMERPDSIYNVLSLESGLYVRSVLNQLRTRKLKQLWRNQLLGEAMLADPELGLKHFTSVLLFPAGNHHFVKASEAYERLLNQEREIKYKAILFEDFIQIGISNTQDKNF